MIAIPVLPLWVWASLDEWQPVLWWLLPLGALLGLALHLANTLPDIESDAAHGIDGFAHLLGSVRTRYVAWLSFAAALLLSLALAPVIDCDLRLYFAVLAFGAACLTASMLAHLVAGERWAAGVGFGLLSLGAVMLAVGWLAAVT
jgi:4-hydroxybenzoate polyprenyltransferase